MKSQTGVPVRNLYFLFAYAWDQFEVASQLASGEELGPDAAPFFARVLLRGCHRLFRRGLDRRYEPTLEDTARIRGRIVIGDTLRRDLLRQGRAICEFDELKHDAVHNQILKSTLRRLLQDPKIQGAIRSELRDAVRFLDSVGVSDILLRDSTFFRVQLHRNNLHYRLLLHICELLHRHLFPGEGGQIKTFNDLLYDDTRMGDVFERFVRNFYKSEQSTYAVTSERISWMVEEGDLQSLALLPSMRTDVSLRSSNRTLVIDTKYYSQTLTGFHGKEALRSSHLYQLFAYLKNMESTGGNDAAAEGILLYPTVTREVAMKARIHSHVVQAQTLDLRMPWADIRDRLLSIIE